MAAPTTTPPNKGVFVGFPDALALQVGCPNLHDQLSGLRISRIVLTWSQLGKGWDMTIRPPETGSRV
jgi:hypothetical protein